MNQMYQIMTVSHFISGCEAKKQTKHNYVVSKPSLGVWVALAVTILAVADSTELPDN